VVAEWLPPLAAPKTLIVAAKFEATRRSQILQRRVDFFRGK
jgi:hypothetical protein